MKFEYIGYGSFNCFLQEAFRYTEGVIDDLQNCTLVLSFVVSKYKEKIKKKKCKIYLRLKFFICNLVLSYVFLCRQQYSTYMKVYSGRREASGGRCDKFH